MSIINRVTVSQAVGQAANAVRQFVGSNPIYLYQDVPDRRGIQRRIAISILPQRREIGHIAVTPMADNPWISDVQWFGNGSREGETFWLALTGYLVELPVMNIQLDRHRPADEIAGLFGEFVEQSTVVWPERIKPYLDKNVYVHYDGPKTVLQTYKVYPDDKLPATPVTQIIIDDKTVLLQCLLDDPVSRRFFTQMKEWFNHAKIN